MTLPGKLAEEGPVAENVNILWMAERIRKPQCLQMKSCPKNFGLSILF